jgi:hypothetical protein
MRSPPFTIHPGTTTLQPDEWTKVDGLRDLAPRLNLEHEERDGRVSTIRPRP